MRKSVEGIAMSVVEFPGQPKRQPFAVAAFDPKRERMLLRAERVVELLSSRAIRDGWSFGKNRAARFLHCLRTFDPNVASSSEVAEIVNWVSDHEQSLQWMARGGRAGGFHAGGFHAGGYRAAGVRGGRVAGVYHGGVYRGGIYRGGYGGWRPGVAAGVGAAAVGAAAIGAAAAGPYYNSAACGYYPYPPCQ
jgi:hypothetical protein